MNRQERRKEKRNTDKSSHRSVTTTDSGIIIKDNFLPQEEFIRIRDIFLSKISNENESLFIPWIYHDTIDSDDDIDKFQFVHLLYFNSAASSTANIVNPIIEMLQPVSIYRIKSNLLTKTPTIIENKFHVDMEFLTEEKQSQWTTSIFYINTNNGYTEFEIGTKVNSVANRMISFPSNMKHTGTSCTDERTRVVINFNYFGQQ
jgi:hypothetical protein